MILYLEPAVFISSVLDAHQELNSIDFISLRKIRDYVTEKLDEYNLYVNWTRDKVLSDLDCYRDVFGSDDKSVWFLKDFKVGFTFGLTDKFYSDLKKAILEVPIEKNETNSVDRVERFNIVTIAKLIQDSIKEYQMLNPDCSSQKEIEDYAVGQVMKFGRGHYNPKIVQAMVGMERSVYEGERSAHAL